MSVGGGRRRMRRDRGRCGWRAEQSSVFVGRLSRSTESVHLVSWWADLHQSPLVWVFKCVDAFDFLFLYERLLGEQIFADDALIQGWVAVQLLSMSVYSYFQSSSLSYIIKNLMLHLKKDKLKILSWGHTLSLDFRWVLWFYCDWNVFLFFYADLRRKWYNLL